MDLQPEAESSARAAPHWSERLAAFFEICAAALVGGLLAQLGLRLAGIDLARVYDDARLLFVLLAVDALATLALIRLFLGLRGESVPSLAAGGLSGWREAAAGFAWLPVLWAVLLATTGIFSFLLPQYVSQTNPILQLLKSPLDLVLFLISSILAGGIKEEIQRAFALNRFERFLGGPWLGLAAWSAFFGAGHIAQGIDNAFKAGALGLVFGLLYLRRRSLVAPIVCHASYDVMVTLLYWFYGRS